MDIVGTLSNVKNGIQCCLQELDALKKLKYMNQEILTYEHALQTLQVSVDRLTSIYSYNMTVPDSIQLKMQILTILATQITKFFAVLKEYYEWQSTVENGKWYSKCYVMICKPPTKMKEKIDIVFQECFDVMQQVSNLETQILGSAINIKHPILQKAWLAAGMDDLNASERKNSAFEEALFLMLRSELGSIKNKEYCLKLIQAFIERLDGCIGSTPNGLISVNECNEMEIDEQNVNSVLALLGYEQQPEEIQTTQKIPIEFRTPITVDWKHPVELPAADQRYGSGFNNTKALSFQIPAVIKNWFGLSIKCIATDQGWGGTGHAQIRYQINEAHTVPGFSIWRDKNPTGEYEIMLGKNQVKAGDWIHIWVYCPAWNGWKCTLSCVEAYCLTN